MKRKVPEKRRTPPVGADGPFRNLERAVQEAGLRLGKKAEPPPPEPAKASGSSSPLDDETAFLQAVEGVSRAEWHSDVVPARRPPLPPKDQDSEDRRLMEAAVHGAADFPVESHPEYIEGWVGVAGRQYLPRLRDGLYAIQGQLDLHGLARAEARAAVDAFVAAMSRFKPCCVKIIHGRGINSPAGREAVLKESLRQWLATRKLARHVVAYASAPLKDGGVGAIYLLLRPA